MTILPMTIEHLEDSEGLTCIENQLIGILRYSGLPYQATFLKSFVGISDTIRECMVSKIGFAHYDRIERLQFTAQDLKLVRQTYYSPVSYERMLQLMEEQLEEGVPLMIRVDPLKLPRHNDLLPWRDEHFVSLFGIEDDQVFILDDVPLRSISVSLENLSECFQGEALAVRVSDGLVQGEYIRKAKRQVDLITSNMPVEIDSVFIENICSDIGGLVEFRDAIGVVRTSRKRVNSWLKWMETYISNASFAQPCAELEKEINILNKLYSAIEFCRLRCRVNGELLNNLLKTAYEMEASWIYMLWKAEH